jgi:hypothetical protein
MKLCPKIGFFKKSSFYFKFKTFQHFSMVALKIGLLWIFVFLFASCNCESNDEIDPSTLWRKFMQRIEKICLLANADNLVEIQAELNGHAENSCKKFVIPEPVTSIQLDIFCDQAASKMSEKIADDMKIFLSSMINDFVKKCNKGGEIKVLN